MKRNLFITLFLISSLLCHALQYTNWIVEYQASGNYNFVGDRFYIKSQTQNMSSDDVLFKYYASFVAKLFNNKSATRVYSESEANVIIYLYCSISGPHQESGVYYTPQVSIPVNGVIFNYGAPRTYTNLYYCRDLVINAYDKSGQNKWKINVRSVGGSNDYSYVLPLMCYAIRNQIGYSGSDKVTLTDYDGARRFFDY